MVCGEDESVDYLIQSDCDGRWICIWNQMFFLLLASNLPLFMGHTVLILRESLPCTTMVWLLSGTGPDNIVRSVELVLESSACFPDRRICCKHALCAWTVSNQHCKMCSCANENFGLKSLPVQTSRVFRSVLLHLAGVSHSFKAPSCEKANTKRDTRSFYSQVCGFLMTTSRFLNLGPTQYSAIKKCSYWHGAF